MKDWFIFAMIALILFGLWGFFPKLGGSYIKPKSFIIYEALGYLIVTIILLFNVGFKPEFHTKGVTFAILTGIAGVVGTLFFVYSLVNGKVSVVVTMTALYPIITILLASLILKEPITLKQGIGMIFALLAMALFSL